MTTKRELQEQIEALEAYYAMERKHYDAAISSLQRRVETLELRVKVHSHRLEALDKETHAPVRPETWRPVEVPHTDTTAVCACNRCRKGW